MAILAGAAIAAAAERKEKPLKETLEALLPGMGAKNIRDRQGPQQQWQKICFQAGAPGKEALRAEVCTLMAEKLGPQTANPARIWLLKQLQFIGRGECVDAVAKALDDKDKHVRDAARRCLANNPDPKATTRLVEKLASSRDSKLKVGLLNALGYRADRASLGAVARELRNPDQAVACAAARALGKIGTPGAAKVLRSARANAKGELRFRISDAYKLCADNLLKAGKASAAMAAYKELSKPEESRRVRLAALQGMLRAAGDQAGAMILEFLASNDAEARAIAAGHIRDLPSAGVKSLAAGFSKLPEGGQVLLLGALAAKGDKAAMPVAVAASKSKVEQLKVAGLRALATLGDASAVPVLVEAMFAGGRAAGPARNSLVAVYGKGTDEKIVAAMQGEKDRGRRASLISVLEARKAISAVPALLQEAVHDEAHVRRTAMSALRRLAEPKDIPGMVKGMLKAQKGGERDEAEKAILSVCQQIPETDKRADPVLAVVAGVGEREKAAALPLLGRLDGPEAMRMVQAGLKSKNAEHYEAGVRAICNWPDASVVDQLVALLRSAKETRHRVWTLQALARVAAVPSKRPKEEQRTLLKKALAAVRPALKDPDAGVQEAAVRALGDWPSPDAAADLLKLAQSAPKANHRILALRGYIRLAGLVTRRSAQDALKMYREAMRAATRPDERKQILSGVGRVRSLEALKLVMPSLADDAVRREAAWAALGIADGIRGAHPREVRAALQKVLASTKDARIRRRAQEILKRTPAKSKK